jgi:hypothetical protein
MKKTMTVDITPRGDRLVRTFALEGRRMAENIARAQKRRPGSLIQLGDVHAMLNHFNIAIQAMNGSPEEIAAQIECLREQISAASDATQEAIEKLCYRGGEFD